MFELLGNLRKRWNDWCGDREMELAIRKHLTKNGFFGGTAKLQNVRLVAVQRPGWLQVFRFEANRSSATYRIRRGARRTSRCGPRVSPAVWSGAG